MVGRKLGPGVVVVVVVVAEGGTVLSPCHLRGELLSAWTGGGRGEDWGSQLLSYCIVMFDIFKFKNPSYQGNFRFIILYKLHNNDYEE